MSLDIGRTGSGFHLGGSSGASSASGGGAAGGGGPLGSFIGVMGSRFANGSVNGQGGSSAGMAPSSSSASNGAAFAAGKAAVRGLKSHAENHDCVSLVFIYIVGFGAFLLCGLTALARI